MPVLAKPTVNAPRSSGPAPESESSSPPRAAAALVIAVLLGAEVWLVRHLFDTDAFIGDSRPWAALLLATSLAAPLALCIGAALLLLGVERLRAELASLRPLWRSAPAVCLRAPAHALAYGAFFLLTRHVMGSQGEPDLRAPWLALTAWLVAGASVPALAAWAVLPAGALLASLRRSLPLIASSVVLGAAAFALSRVILQTGNWIHLAEWTTWLSRAMLEAISPGSSPYEEFLILGSGEFRVKVTSQCSGYEGIGMTWVFCAAYLWLFRRSLRFPHCLALLPAATLVVWVANAARLAGLTLLGMRVSPDIAMTGFHSYAGWILFCGVSLGIVLVSQRVRWFAVDPPARLDGQVNPAAVYLAPLLAIIAVSFFSGAFSTDFDPFRPLAFVVAAVVLWHYRREHPALLRGAGWPALACGAGACALWVALSSLLGAPEGNDPTPPGLSDLPAAGALAWQTLRVIGYLLITPLAEELAFRGFLYRRLIAKDFEQVSAGRLALLPLLVSSLAFGLLHDQWIAATLAGALFALAMSRRGRLADAVVAHIVVNALLLALAAATGRWELWA